LIVATGVYSFCVRGTHLLLVLLRLEYSSIGVFLLLVSVISGDFIYFLLGFLIFLVCEGAVGLSILVAIRRSHGIGGLLGLQWGFV